MQQYFRDVDGVRCEVRDSGGVGLAVFIFHGNSGAAAQYDSLLHSPLGRRYRLIALSFPGHGASSCQDGAQVNIASLGAWTARAAATFDLERYALIGQSLGGHALLGALQLHARACGLMLVSAPPISLATLGQAFAPDPTGGLLFAKQLSGPECERFARAFVHRAGKSSMEMLCTQIGSTDGRFRAALGASLAAGQLEDEVAAFVGASIPVALVRGRQDAFLREEYYATLSAKHIWSGQVHAFDDCGHAVALDQPDRFAQLTERFLDDVTACGQPVPKEQAYG